LSAIINSISLTKNINVGVSKYLEQSKLKPDLKGTDSLGFNVLTTDHDIATVFVKVGVVMIFRKYRGKKYQGHNKVK
jgi:hypothetical protein